ncbi:MAG: dNTP triphosphohydrolase [Planctomycetales bacterium]|nr:dNTP triphosphohydrolase [Planctomycetales bacterium]
MTEIETATDEWPGLQTIADREQLLLAPYAMHSVDSRGRRHAEPPHAYRGPFQRDRDRVVHSAAYRRLSGKMQVFTGDMGDYHRTRLTHTQEVASIARTMARALRLNEDLVEALALFHDIGHPPFGHCGEDALNECLANAGGFSHNQFALTLAEELEIRYQRFPGLNLSFEVLEGQATRVDKRAGRQSPLLEVQVVDAADSITYDAHDTDDAVKLGMVTLDELCETAMIRESVERVRRSHVGLSSEMMRVAVVHDLIDHQVSDVLRRCGAYLAEQPPESAEDARRRPFRIGPTAELNEKKQALERLLFQRVYRHPRLTSVRSEAQSRLRAMFDAYCQHPEWLSKRFDGRVERVGVERAVGEYLAGMTDRYFEQQFQRRLAAGHGG